MVDEGASPGGSVAEGLAECRSAGRRIGVAVGAFGLIHAGTVRFLRAARGECDSLFVALLAPSAIPAGGERAGQLLRPDERFRLLESLQDVDAVARIDQQGGMSLAELHAAAPGAEWLGSADDKDVDAATRDELRRLGVAVRDIVAAAGCTTQSVLRRMQD